ncbi:MAG: C40 family peptidase [Thermomicrobiales bacterium]
MSIRALARSCVLQHAGRVIALALVAVTGLASASPAAAWETYWQTYQATAWPSPPKTNDSSPDQQAVLIAWTGPRNLSAFELRIASYSPANQKASMASMLPERSTGDLIASTALGYVGYPYIYGAAGPGGFDCSGFTQYIVGITTGIWMSHAVEAQAGSAGTWVDYGNWKPGDLIYFQNTYRAGISHAAIYIGDGLFVHAENESTGVTIDSIYSSYYAPRYWGAYRIR